MSLLGVALARPDLGPRTPDRYCAEARRAEQKRLMRFVPLEKRGAQLPDERRVMRNLMGDLDLAIAKSGLFRSDGFEKRLQFLGEHAKTGQVAQSDDCGLGYEGDVLFGLRHGKGTLKFREEAYEGEWKWDQRHGTGTLTMSDGSKVKGEWKGGKPDGYVNVIDAKGGVTYEGEFKDGKRHGLGRQLFETGDVYDGSWKDGRLHGRGVYYHTANGDKLYGMWREGLYDGVGVCYGGDGAVSRRVYKDGLLMSSQDYDHGEQRFRKPADRAALQGHALPPAAK